MQLTGHRQHLRHFARRDERVLRLLRLWFLLGAAVVGAGHLEVRLFVSYRPVERDLLVFVASLVCVVE